MPDRFDSCERRLRVIADADRRRRATLATSRPEVPLQHSLIGNLVLRTVSEWLAIIQMRYWINPAGFDTFYI